jgi:hypothetical protein
MAVSALSPPRDAAASACFSRAPGSWGLITELEQTRSTTSPGYSIRAMVGLALVKNVSTLPTWTRTVSLVKDHAGFRETCRAGPSVDTACRFARKRAPAGRRP